VDNPFSPRYLPPQHILSLCTSFLALSEYQFSSVSSEHDPTQPLSLFPLSFLNWTSLNAFPPRVSLLSLSVVLQGLYLGSMSSLSLFRAQYRNRKHPTALGASPMTFRSMRSPLSIPSSLVLSKLKTRSPPNHGFYRYGKVP